MQTETISHSRAGDLPAAEGGMAAPIDPGPYLGQWRNSNPKSTGISSFTLARRGDAVVIRAESADSAVVWPETEITMFATSVAGDKLSAFSALIDFGFMESFLAGNINLGLIVIATFNRFKDESGRADYFAREYYFHE